MHPVMHRRIDAPADPHRPNRAPHVMGQRHARYWVSRRDRMLGSRDREIP